jgi:hypothetical protein
MKDKTRTTDGRILSDILKNVYNKQISFSLICFFF